MDINNMAQRLNHARVNMQKRIQEENVWYNKPDGGYYYDREPKPKKRPIPKWQPFGFKDCVGMTAAVMFFRRQYKFRWVVKNSIPLQNPPNDAQKGRQRMRQWQNLMKVDLRSQCILLPEKYRDTHEFVWVVDSAGIFENIVIAEIGTKIRIPDGSRIVKRTAELDVTGVERYLRPDVGFTRMALCIEQIFLSGKNTYSAAERFFDDDRNFNMSKLRKLQDDLD